MPASLAAPAFANTKRANLAGSATGVTVVLFSLAAACGITYLLYGAVQHVFRIAIDERLQAMASIAALAFDPKELDGISGRESVDTPVYQNTVLRLQRIRSQARNIRFVYI